MKYHRLVICLVPRMFAGLLAPGASSYRSDWELARAPAQLEAQLGIYFQRTIQSRKGTEKKYIYR